MIWQKGRSDATSHSIHDAVRGATWEIYTSATDADANYAQTCKSFDSDGFTVGTDGGWNASGQTKVGWCWKAGSTAAKAVGWAMKRNDGSSNAQRISLHAHVAVIGGDPWTRSGACSKDRSRPTW